MWVIRDTPAQEPSSPSSAAGPAAVWLADQKDNKALMGAALPICRCAQRASASTFPPVPPGRSSTLPKDPSIETRPAHPILVLWGTGPFSLPLIPGPSANPSASVVFCDDRLGAGSRGYAWWRGVLAWSDPAHFGGVQDGLGAVDDVHLGVRAVEMGTDCACRQAEFVGDRCVDFAGGEQFQRHGLLLAQR
jgi:hypothetical protein